MMNPRKKKYVAAYQLKRWALALFLLAGLACAKAALFRIPPQAESYHQRVVDVAAATPTHFGTWVSQEVPMPEAAMTMLRPNVVISRRYTNIATGEEATVLLIQCRDARDIFGHYPPVCYTAHGFKEVDSVERDWQVANLSVKGISYTFSSTQPEQLSSMIIYDFMILPNGTTCRDMTGVYASGRDPRRRMFGAAQMQVLLSATMPVEERDALFTEIVKVNQPTLAAILGGEAK